MDPKTAERLQRLQARHRALAASLAGVGFATRGSVVAATSTCGQPTCRCHTDPTRRHGPYWQWTRAVAGKTRTRRLSEVEAERFLEWVTNRRRIEAILKEMEKIALKAADLLKKAEGVERASSQRNRRSKTPA